MGKLFVEYLPDPNVYICSQCHAHLASPSQLISKSFHGRFGRAYLFHQVINIETGPTQEKMLLTGLHSVCDVHCSRCHQYIGWRYEDAFEPEQRYKIGKIILEKGHLVREGNQNSDSEE